MRALSAAELLQVWEQGVTQTGLHQALLLLLAACPESASEELAGLSIGERDGRLMTLREWAFGPRLESVVLCPQCAEQLQFTFDVADVRAPAVTEPSALFSTQVAGYEVNFRTPCSRDLFALGGQTSAADQRKTLLAGCLLSATHDGTDTAVEQLPAEVLEAIVAQMAEQDPQANVQLSLICPACAHQWQALFDIVSFFWSEICTWAQRILQEVHLLAFTYGWREADILAMSPRRRQLYLEMIGG